MLDILLSWIIRLGQIYGENAHHGIGVDETRNKLSYDLYYVKNRSLALDLQIALKI
jgi:lipopolysaccharide/colanic/teichoic acid biosynthesis glycosyltransferase